VACSLVCGTLGLVSLLIFICKFSMSGLVWSGKDEVGCPGTIMRRSLFSLCLHHLVGFFILHGIQRGISYFTVSPFARLILPYLVWIMLDTMFSLLDRWAKGVFVTYEKMFEYEYVVGQDEKSVRCSLECMMEP